VEWVRFAQVERVPAQGEIVAAADTWEEPAGGGAVAAGELIRLGADVDFFVAVGNDELGNQARAALEREE
jgi:ribokinase